MGAGNRLRGDDAAGLEIVTRLRALLGPAPAPGLKIHGTSKSPERLLSKLSSKPGKIVIFDAVEASRGPGDVVFCRLSDTKHGFFATHNIPIRLIPGLDGREQDVYLLGVQPESMEVKEGLSHRVSDSVDRVVSAVAEGVARRA